MKTQVYKFQRPVAGCGDVLVYNKNRTEQGNLQLSEPLKMMFGENFRIYVAGRLRKDGNIEIDRIVEDQEW